MHPKRSSYEHKKYEAWVRKKPCVICGQKPAQLHHYWHGRYNSFLGIPLCVQHHMPGFPDSYHHLEVDKFEDKHSVKGEFIIINLLSEFIQERGIK